MPCLWQSVVLESESEEARGRQARVQTGGVPVRYMRTGVLFAQLIDDAYLHIPQDAAHDAVAATTASCAPATHHPLRCQVLVFDIQRVSNTTTASQRRHQRATRLSALPTDVQLLLLAEETLPGQARAVRYAIRVRVLPAAVPDQKQLDHAQEPTAQGLGGGAKTSDENLRSGNLVRRRCRNTNATAAAVIVFVVRVSTPETTVTVTTAGRLQRLPVVVVVVVAAVIAAVIVCSVSVTTTTNNTTAYRKHGIGE